MKPGDPGYDNELDRARKEAAKYRTKYAKYRDVFERFTDDEQSALLGIVNDLAEDTESGAYKFRDFSYAVLGAKFNENAPWETIGDLQEDSQMTDATSSDPTDDAVVQANAAAQSGHLTEERLLAILDERDRRIQERNQELEIQSILNEVKAAGFEEGTREHAMVLWVMANETDGDLDAAVAAVRGDSTESTDEKSSSSDSSTEDGSSSSTEDSSSAEGSASSASDTSDDSGPTFPLTGVAGAPGAVGTSDDKDVPADFDEASRRALARLSGSPGE